ncbi:hypothetical protein DACRYDRAFT_20185 [Dacryopinax primogenitus]|uniref:Uncharacterized protein n=1 Tax=Dacryopinax primogenitus (strain DJM 731) TaxID=1858805 RepID=M5GEY5_DACPD|nr:uncharacterized protein DACRYDRAFT_20185 [Dacryopinax primogenitus]EJU05812.1 hypothetical protein DACRYDRAFT_20185 [Dacryopinax primogenitus]
MRRAKTVSFELEAAEGWEPLHLTQVKGALPLSPTPLWTDKLKRQMPQVLPLSQYALYCP